MAAIKSGFIDTIGNTPLIFLRKLSEETGCTILGKAEFLNPGGSVKDRAAWAIVKDAEERGLLKPGGTIVEGTAGNTGIGLTHVANARGYKSVIVMPETQSQEKKDTLRMLGADLRLVPAVPYNQFDNTANSKGHYETTGPEIWQDTKGKIYGYVSAVGSGGTLSGISRYLKEQSPDIKVAVADPEGAAIASYFNTGELRSEGNSIMEGIGQGRVTENIKEAKVDVAYTIPDSEALPYAFDLLQNEGFSVGGSSGINMAGAVRLAKELGPGHTIVTLLCDSGQRYASKMFNPEFLKEKGLPLPNWL